MMRISPGTTRPKLSEVRPLLASSMSSRCINTPMMRMMKLLLILIITFAKIWLMRMLPIIRLKPSMIPMQKILGKFSLERTPNTPQNSSKDRSLPPKKQPNQMKLNPMKKLKIKTLRKRGQEGVQQRQEKQTLMADPKIERRSPIMRERFEQERQRSLGLPNSTAPLIESYSISTIPATIRIVPALSNQCRSFPANIFFATMKRLWRLIRLNVWIMEVSLTAYLTIRNQMQILMLLMKFFLIISLLMSEKISPPTAAICLFSQATNGSVSRETVKNRQEF